MVIRVVKRGSLGWLLGWFKRGQFRVAILGLLKTGNFGWLKTSCCGQLLG